jgi:amino acid transporter
MNKLRPQLGVIEAMALSVGIMAPTAAMALNGSLAASITGTAVALAFLGAFITIVLTSYSFIEFSRQFAHAGSVYVFNGISFGARAGFLSAWGLLLTYTAFTIASTAEVGLFFQTFLALLGPTVHWIFPALIAAGAIWFLAHREVRLSIRVTIAVEGLSVLLILVLVAVILGRGGAHGLSLQPFAIPQAGLSACSRSFLSPGSRALPPSARRPATPSGPSPGRSWSPSSSQAPSTWSSATARRSASGWTARV